MARVRVAARRAAGSTNTVGSVLLLSARDCFERDGEVGEGEQERVDQMNTSNEFGEKIKPFVETFGIKPPLTP